MDLSSFSTNFQSIGLFVFMYPGKIGPYTPTQLLQEGGGGTVFLAQTPSTQVVIKELDNFLHNRQEAALSLQFKHGSLVNTFEVIEKENKIYLIMEKIDGLNLSNFLKKKGKISPSNALKWTYEIADGLSYIHDFCDLTKNIHGFIHGDVSPANILIDYGGKAYLCDYGLTRPIVGHSSLNSQPPYFNGKIRYAAPEELMKPFIINERSDLFSLGVCLYEMLTGSPLFSGDTLSPIIKENLSLAYYKKLQPLSPVLLKQLLQTLLFPSPIGRFQTANALKTACVRLLEIYPI